MKWIGLTGGIASGKSTVAQMLRDLGVVVVDADQIAHGLMLPGAPVYKRVVETFGQTILDPDKSLNRRRLGQLVFGRPDLLLQLEDLTHPEVRREVQKTRAELARQGTPIAVYDVPLLFEKNMQDDFDAIVCVTTTPELQRDRMRSRNRWSEDEISARIASQVPMGEKMQRATFVIENSTNLDDLRARTREVMEALKGVRPARK